MNDRGRCRAARAAKNCGKCLLYKGKKEGRKVNVEFVEAVEVVKGVEFVEVVKVVEVVEVV